MKKYCFVATLPQSVNVFLSDVIQKLSENQVVKVISHPKGGEVISALGVEYIPINIERKPSLFKDFITLVNLILIFKKERFDLIHSIMPKAGLLTMLAAYLTRSPVRIHTFTGQVWCNMHGYKKCLFKFLDKILVFCSTQILVDSESQRDFLISEGVLKKNQAIVIGKGSICGVDTDKFSFDSDKRLSIRQSLGLNEDAVVILYMARLTKQKGILELAEAFARIAEIRKNAYLYVIGPEEDASFAEVIDLCKLAQQKVFRLEYTNTPTAYLSASDIFCLPSHMEGFGQVLVNASSCKLPIVASRIYGIVDAVEDGITGVLYPCGDIDALTNNLLKLIDNENLRKEIGLAGRLRVEKHFDKNFVTGEILNFYTKSLK